MLLTHAIAAVLPVVLIATSPAAPPTRVTVLYDAFGDRQDFTKDWGFAALVELGQSIRSPIGCATTTRPAAARASRASQPSAGSTPGATITPAWEPPSTSDGVVDCRYPVD
jgi:hypothetical protein